MSPFTTLWITHETGGILKSVHGVSVSFIDKSFAHSMASELTPNRLAILTIVSQAIILYDFAFSFLTESEFSDFCCIREFCDTVSKSVLTSPDLFM